MTMSARIKKTSASENRTELKDSASPPTKPTESPEIKGNGSANDLYMRVMLLQSKLQLTLFDHNEQLRCKNQEIIDSRRRFAYLFNLAPVGYLTLDPNNRIVEANICSATLLVHTIKDLSGRDFIQFVSPAYAQAFHQHREQAHVGKRDSFELELVNSLGKSFHAKIETYLNEDRLWLMAIMDISARQKAQDQARSTMDELQRANEKLRAETIERQLAESKLREFAQKMIEAQESERHRIARELHDHVGQLMTYMGLLLDKAKSQLDPDIYRDAKSVARETLALIRNLSSDLQPSMLASVGLLPSLRALFERYYSLTKVRVEFSCDSMPSEPPHDTGLTAYRIIQEALTNVARHAQVDAVRVRLGNQNGCMKIEVEDKGQGFDPVLKLNCAGLTGMKERAQAIGGNLWIDSIPSQGTRIVAQLPVTSFS